MKKLFLEAIATMTGAIIGAGILGIPFVVAKSGFLIGVINIVLIGLIVLIINLYLGEIVLSTKGNHQLIGYAKKYLGVNGKRLMTFTIIFWIYGALVAYLIGIGDSLNAIFNFSSLLFSLIIFAVLSFFVYKGLRLIKRYELILSSIMISIVLLILAFVFNKVNLDNLKTINFGNLMAPYGIVLFALLGAFAVPELKEILSRDRKNLKKAIILGVLIPIFIYIIFTFSVISVAGVNTKEIATVSLGEIFGFKMVLFANLFAVFAMMTSFLVAGLALKQVFNYDYGYSEKISWFLTCLIPLALFIFLRNFIGFKDILSITGIFAGGLGSILIVLMSWNLKKYRDLKIDYGLSKNKFVGIILILVFAVGIVISIV